MWFLVPHGAPGHQEVSIFLDLNLHESAPTSATEEIHSNSHNAVFFVGVLIVVRIRECDWIFTQRK